VYDNYESDYELDMQDFQDYTTESYPLFNKNIVMKSTVLGLQNSLSSRLKKGIFPQALFMMIMNLILQKSMKERKRRRGILVPILSL
jgi:hypothetical protein